MPEFKCLSESELDRLDDEGLVEYVAAAREAGNDGCARRGAGVLAHGFWDRVRARVALKVPRDDVDDVAMAVMESAIKSAFEGKVIGQFVNWLNRITARRIADFHRERRPKTEPLPEEHEENEEIWGIGAVTGDETETVAVRDAAQRVLAPRSPLHRRVIKLYGPSELGFLDRSAAKTRAELLGNPGEAVSEANIHQIWRRFKKDLEDELGKAPEGDG